MKHSFKIIIGVFVFSMLSFYSCEKVNINTSNEKSKEVKFTTDFDYANYHLNVISQGLAGLSSNQNFVNILHDKVNEQFDGDYNVLLQDLISECTNNNIDMVLQMKLFLDANDMDSSLITDALVAFDNINGHKYYIQIFIPFFDENQNFSSNLPVTLSFNGDESISSYTGSGLNNSESLDEIPDINEDYAINNEVWVISLNENVDDNGTLLTPINPITKEVMREIPEPTGTPNGSTINMMIDKMTVKSHYETFVAGKSDIAFRSFITYYNGLKNSIKYQEMINGVNSERGDLIKQFKRKWVNDLTEKDLNWGVINKWENEDYYNERVLQGIVIFERDIWPAPIKVTPDMQAVSQYFGIEYRSNDDCYLCGLVKSIDGIGSDPYFVLTRNLTEMKVNFAEN